MGTTPYRISRIELQPVGEFLACGDVVPVTVGGFDDLSERVGFRIEALTHGEFVISILVEPREYHRDLGRDEIGDDFIWGQSTVRITIEREQGGARGSYFRH